MLPPKLEKIMNASELASLFVSVVSTRSGEKLMTSYYEDELDQDTLEAEFAKLLAKKLDQA